MTTDELLELCADGEEHFIGEGVSAKQVEHDLDIHVNEKLVAWITPNGRHHMLFDKSSGIDASMRNRVCRLVDGFGSLEPEFFEPQENAESFDHMNTDRIKELEAELEDTNSQLDTERGKVAVYERLIAGGFTNLSK